MALIKCSECQNEISSEATQCPNCGKPQEKARKEERLKVRSSTQNAGCLAMILAMVLAFFVPPLGGVLFLAGVLMLLWGLVR